MEYADVAIAGDEIVVSERFVGFVKGALLKGLSEFEPVEVFNVRHRRTKPSQPMPRYFKSTVVLSPTTVDQNASEYVWSDEASVCPICLRGDELKRFRRIVIKEDTWNGDDVFFARGGTRLIVSERFKSLCGQDNIRGVVFSAAEDYGYEYCPWEREDWDLREFDETFAILRSQNAGGRFDGFLQAMREIRGKVASDPKFEWIETLRQRFGEEISDVADAAGDAYYKMIRNP
jgi:hypothetical protein